LDIFWLLFWNYIWDYFEQFEAILDPSFDNFEISFVAVLGLFLDYFEDTFGTI